MESEDPCPEAGAEGTLSVGVCKAFMSGGSRLITCHGPIWPTFMAVTLFIILLAAGAVYWKKLRLKFVSFGVVDTLASLTLPLIKCS